MNLTSWIRRQQPETRAAANYTDAWVQQLIRGADGSGDANVEASGALQTASQMVAQGFMACTVSGVSPFIAAALTPDFFALTARTLYRKGEVIFFIDTSEDELALLPASHCQIEGPPHPKRQVYRLTLPGPTSDLSVVVPSAGVVHLKYSANVDRPYQGVSVSASASIAAQFTASANLSMADESAMSHGAFLPMATEPSDTTMSALSDKINLMRGRVTAVKTNRDSGGAIPQDDYKANRLGATPPPGFVQARTDADLAFYNAATIPIELVTGQGDATAAWRRMLFGVILPLAKMVEAELRVKLESPMLALEFSELRAADVQARSRAYAAFRKGGLSVADASLNAGITLQDTYAADAPALPISQSQ